MVKKNFLFVDLCLLKLKKTKKNPKTPKVEIDCFLVFVATNTFRSFVVSEALLNVNNP